MDLPGGAGGAPATADRRQQQATPEAREAACLFCCGEPEVGDGCSWARALPCGHDCWHAQCILHWLSECRTCPLCRAGVPPTWFAGAGAHGRAPCAEPGDGEAASREGLGPPAPLEETAGLRAALASLAERARELEEERRALQLQVRQLERRALEARVRGLERELAARRSQVACLEAEGLALRASLAAQRWRRPCTVPTRRHAEAGGPAGPPPAAAGRAPCPPPAGPSAGAPPREAAPRCGLGDECTEWRAARAAVARLRAAVLHAPCTAAEVFRALAARSGRLRRHEALRVLRRLDPAAPGGALARAFLLLDTDASGAVEEADWMFALRLPHVEVTVQS